jgi:hypothetical protein
MSLPYGRLPLVLLILLTAVALAYRIARIPRRARWILLAIVCVTILAAPLLIRPHARIARFFLSVLSLMLTIKVYDFHRSLSHHSLPSGKDFARFMANPFTQVFGKIDEPSRSGRQDIRQFIFGLGLFGFGLPLLIGVFRLDWTGHSFALEHCAKVISFFLSLLGLAAALTAVTRLGGIPARNVFGNIFAAITPADFWRRYNRATGQWFHENVFKPAGGRRHPVRAALVTFMVSSVIHEYVFAIPVGHIQGYQTAFFMVQGIAVVATLRWRPSGAVVPVAIAATLAFNLASGVLFFASVNHVVPFYTARTPSVVR